MACCTTIPPLNPSQKRQSGGMFDLPRTAKKRRPLSSTTLSVAPYLSNQNSSSCNNTTMVTSANNSNIFNYSNAEKQPSVFQTKDTLSFSNSFSNQNEENNDLMERIKHEAKRFFKRKQLSLGSTITTSSNNNVQNNNNNRSNINNNGHIAPLKHLSSISSSNFSHTSIKTTDEQSSNIDRSLLKDVESASTESTQKKDCISISDLNKDANIINQNSNNSFSSLLTNSSLSNETKLSYNDLPIFSMNQVNKICERMLRERELAIREQYDKILSQKMNEQYDTFVKFTHEQIQRRFESSQCSYVS